MVYWDQYYWINFIENLGYTCINVYRHSNDQYIEKRGLQ